MNYFLLLKLILLSSCSSMESYKKKSVGHTGCAWTEIEISEVEEHRWIATCDGKQYRCNDSGHSPVCKLQTEI